MSYRILVSCPHLQSTIDEWRPVLEAQDITLDLPTVVQQLTESELVEIIGDYDGVIAGDDQFTNEVLKKGTRLKVISKWGVGLDGIDLEVAAQLGIQVYNTPNTFTDELADLVMGYIVILARRLYDIDRSVRSGGWDQLRGISLSGKTLGIIGLGNIGQAVAKRATVSGMSVIGYDVVNTVTVGSMIGAVRNVSFDDVLKESDFISVNCNLTETNRHMLSYKQFSAMKEGVFLVNTARGPLVDEGALIEAINSGKVGGAALDVFESEPLPHDSALRTFSNCIFGAHNGSNTLEAVNRVNALAIDNLFQGLGIKASLD